jgi:glycosyltransferase involved in cell wall biosynthesis
MYNGKTISLILPARNEIMALGAVLNHVPPEVDRVLVVDNGSTDGTAQVAKILGAEVVQEPKPGYGRACLAGLAALRQDPPDMVAFADADGSDDLSRLKDLFHLVAEGYRDLALSRRIPADRNAFSLPQRFGNRLGTRLIHLFWGHRYHDLGPMRVISWRALQRLDMQDQNFGWTLEMQIKAVKHGLRVKEVAIRYRPRAAGRSKVSGNVKGVLRAGVKFFWVIGRELFNRERIEDPAGKHAPSFSSDCGPFVPPHDP